MMDLKSWPWKKRTSNKAAAAESVLDSATSFSDPAASQIQQPTIVKKDDYKKPKYVQISVETYSYLTGLEDQVKSYEERVITLEEEIKDLNENILESQTEMTNKDNLVKQHTKVAEEAVSGWEKAEAEADALKSHLESVTLLKLTAEDRASHLDGALKECMREIRNLKEEHSQELQDVVFTKTKQFDELKLELESKLATLEQEKLRFAAENAALSRSLQDCSSMLIKLNEEKMQAEAEIEILKSTIGSNQKEMHSLQYEVHMVTKQMEIRNEEKNMSICSAEAANKQHLEGVKKIARLEAECQRLRGLVRKKLPGPAALAQMKLEVENLGRDQGDSRFRRSPVKPPTHHLAPLPEVSHDTVQTYHKDNDLLTERLLAMEEETKMLKEALANRNSELQASRSTCANTASKLQILEAQLQSNGEHRSPPKLKCQLPIDDSFHRTATNPRNLTSLSVDASDDDASCAGSWATPSVSEFSYSKYEKKTNSPNMSENANHSELMDDFLEMEKLAHQSNGSNEALSSFAGSSTEVINKEGSVLEENHEPDLSMNQISSKRDISGPDLGNNKDFAVKLQFRLTSIINSLSTNTHINQALEELRCVVQDTDNKLHHQSESSILEASNFLCPTSDYKNDAKLASGKDIVLSCDSEHLSETLPSISQELRTAISRIQEFFLVLGKEAMAVRATSFDSEGLSQLMEQLSTTYEEVVNKKTSLVQFVFDLSHLIGKFNELQYKVMGYSISKVETGTSDCIDKVALPENKASFGSSGDTYLNSCPNAYPDIPYKGSPDRTSELSTNLWKCSLEEFQQLKSEKDNLVINLSACSENLKNTKTQLQEAERHLAEVKLQLTSAHKSNGLSETQLKCMAESYKALETRSEKLQAEVNRLQATVDGLEIELQEERRSHQEGLSRCKDLEDQLRRIESVKSADFDAKTNEERKIAAASEKLAECQETILLLGKQLNAMRPQTETELSVSTYSEERSQDDEFDKEPAATGSISNMNWEDTHHSESDMSASMHLHKAGDDLYLNSSSQPVSSKHHRHRSTQSVSFSSSSSSSSSMPEKHSRGLSRFFSTKAKNDC